MVISEKNRLKIQFLNPSFLWLGFIYLFIIFKVNGQENCYNFSIKDQQDLKLIKDFYIKIYNDSKTLVLYDNDTGKICVPIKLFSKADSLTVHHNFQQKIIPKSYDFSNPMLFKTESALDEIVLNSKKRYTEIGPTKGKTIPFILGKNHISVLSFEIDSLTAGLNVEEIKFHFRGAGLFIPTRSYNAQFKVLIYHSLNPSFKNMNQLVNNNENHVVDFRGRGWLDVDLSKLKLKIPDKGYIIYGLQCLSSELNISQNKVNKNKGLMSVIIYLYRFREPFIIINKSEHVPRIKLELSSYK